MFLQYICIAFKNAERGSHTSFQFKEDNNGYVELKIVPNQEEEGWSVIPSEEPLKVSYFRLQMRIFKIIIIGQAEQHR